MRFSLQTISDYKELRLWDARIKCLNSFTEYLVREIDFKRIYNLLCNKLHGKMKQKCASSALANSACIQWGRRSKTCLRAIDPLCRSFEMLESNRRILMASSSDDSFILYPSNSIDKMNY